MSQLPDELQPLKDFHGHLGPFVVIGYLAGVRALEGLRARKYFGISARVECEPEPPQSCLADGVQFAAGCTFGKRNISIHAASDVAVHFENTDTGEMLRLTLRQGLAEQTKAWLDELGDEVAALRTYELGDAVFA
ncbi:MAG: formylmethanofuran dehydrogenase subunit E family protein [Armatimonadota bacterium]